MCSNRQFFSRKHLPWLDFEICAIYEIPRVDNFPTVFDGSRTLLIKFASACHIHKQYHVKIVENPRSQFKEILSKDAITCLDNDSRESQQIPMWTIQQERHTTFLPCWNSIFCGRFIWDVFGLFSLANLKVTSKSTSSFQVSRNFLIFRSVN